MTLIEVNILEKVSVFLSLSSFISHMTLFTQVNFPSVDRIALVRPVSRMVIEASLLEYTLVVRFSHRLAVH